MAADGRRPDVIGQTIRLSGRPFTVVGVAQRGFGGSLAFVTPELWVPTGVYDTITNDIMRGGWARHSPIDASTA